MSTQSRPMDTGHPHVERRPQVQGGRPVIRGSRFPVSSIIQDYRRGLSVEELLREFPSLKPAEIHAALSYYYDHQAELDQEITELTNLDAAMQQYPPTIRPSDDGRH